MSTPVGFGAGLGTVIGASIGAADLNAGQSNVDNDTSQFQNTTAPDVQFGQSFIPTATNAINSLQSTAGNTQSYEQFLQGYQMTPGAQYQEGVANQQQNSSAAATGQLLSGSNERALGTIDQGIANTDANSSYSQYLAGNNQQFGQLNTALGDMFNAIGVGTTATGQQASVDSSEIGATSQIAQAQAKNAQSKGSGIGSIFGALPTVPSGNTTA
jgi:hypothetical protein